MFRRRTNFPGIPPQAVKEFIGLQDDLQADSRSLREEAIGSTTDTKTANYSARFNERIRVLPPTAGLSLIFPGADSKSQNRWIEVLKLGGGTCTVVPTSGQVMGAPSFPLTLAGFYYFQSDGLSGWWLQPSASGGLSPPVAFADIQTIPANTWLGNITAGIASVTANTVAQLKTYIGNFGAGVAGLVPNTSAGSATTFLNGAGGFTTPAGSPPTVGTQSLFGNPTGAPAVGSDIAVGTESLVGRSSGNVTTFASSVQSVLIRAAGSLFFATAAANQLLGRTATGDLGFNNITSYAIPGRLLARTIYTSGTALTHNHAAGATTCIIEGVGAGGAAGGMSATAGSFGSGGGSGTWGRRRITLAAASSTYTVGAAGTGVSGANGNAGTASTWTHNAVVTTLPGGSGGLFTAGAASAALALGGAGGGAATNADVSSQGERGDWGERTAVATTPCYGGSGGTTPLGMGGRGGATRATVVAGEVAEGPGAGGGGSANGTTATAAAGANGGAGVWIVDDYA